MSSVLAQSLTGMPLTPFEWLKSVERKLNRTGTWHSDIPVAGFAVQVTQKPSTETLSIWTCRCLCTSPPPWSGSTYSTANNFPPRWWASLEPRPSFHSCQQVKGFALWSSSSKETRTQVLYRTGSWVIIGGQVSSIERLYACPLLRYVIGTSFGFFTIAVGARKEALNRNLELFTMVSIRQ